MEERLTVRIGANLSDFERKMSKMQSKMNDVGKSMSSIGSSMTKYITAPAAGVVAAAAGITAAFGWKRLASLDTAQAQLRGLGYETKDVERITDNLVGALDGGMMTMADATFAAANAMAAGVQEGDELTKYIQMLDAAVVGGNGTFEEMQQIFSRVADEGSLTRREFDMMADRMPGFSQAVSEYAGASGDALYDMLNNGEITLDDFLEVMESHGGDMATEYAKTWRGMVENTKNYVGILGENLLKGVFEDSKLAIAEFVELLSSETVQQRAREIGETIANSFGKVLDSVRGLITWFSDLSSGAKKAIGVFAGLAVAAGPVLLVIGKMITFVSGVAAALAPLMASITKAGGLLKWLAPLFGALTSPITLTIAGIAALGAGFVIAYNKSETFRNFVDGIKEKFLTAIEWIGQFKDGIIGLFQDDGMAGIDILTSIGISQEMADKLWEFTGHFIEFYHNVKEQVDKVIGVISGIFEVFKGNEISGTTMLLSLGLSPETVGQILSSVSTIKNAFEDVKDKINNALSTIKDFFIQQFEGIRAWWDSDGALIFDAIGTVVSKVFEIITFTVDTALAIVVDLFKRFAPIVEGIWGVLWPTIEYLVKTTWSSIQFVIGTAMDLIQGIISAVSAIIQGDWSAFGEALKTMALSIKDRVVEHFGNLKANALRLFNELFAGAIQWFQNMWSNVTTKAGQIKTDVVNRFNELKNGAIQKVTEAYNSITTWFSNLWTNVTNKARDIKDGVTNRFNEMKDNAVRGVQRLYDSTSNLFDKVKSYASNTFDNMVKGAKDLPGRIGSAIKNMAHKAVEGITSLGRSMGSKMESVVNSVIGGLNKVLKAIGVNEIGTISINAGGGSATGAAGAIRRFSTGTRNGAIANDMYGMVNDRGPGNGRGGATQELIQRNGQLFAPRGKNAIVPLKKGDRIFNGAETQSLMSSGVIPRFSQGTGAEGGNSGKKKGFFGTLKDVVSNVWDYISNPGKAFEAIISSVTANFDGFDGFAGKMLSGGFKMVTDGIKNFIAKIFKENEGALGSGKAGNWMNYRMTTPYSPNRPVPGYPTGFNGGRHYGIDYGTPIGTPITATTGGQLSSFWNEGGGKIAKLVTGQLRQFFMHMQTVAPNGSVKAGDVIGKSGNSGRWTTGPHVHWQAQQGTDALNRNTIDPRKVIGHANGGIFSHQHVANFAEEGPEAIIPLSAKRRGRANSLYDSVGKAIGRDDGQQYRTMIDNQQKQIERMDKTINILLGIEDKTGFDPGKAKKSIDRHVDDRAIIY